MVAIASGMPSGDAGCSGFRTDASSTQHWGGEHYDGIKVGLEEEKGVEYRSAPLVDDPVH
jgi:hypothetical protein